ncbi:MAG: hypothetical protein AB8G14_13120 [Ilumatobacter sp.]
MGAATVVDAAPHGDGGGGGGGVDVPVEVEGELAVGELRASPSVGYTSINPERILDTRDGVGAPRAPLGANDFLTLSVLGKAGVPRLRVDSVVLNVTAVNPSAQRSFLTVWPQGANRPETSNINFERGQTVPNLVVAKVSESGRVNIFNNAGDVDVLADIVGYHASTSDFTGLVPERFLDTRSGVGAPTGKVGAGETIALQITGRGQVPSAGVDAVVMNLTANQPTSQSFATVWPAGIGRPDASNVNFTAGRTVANLVIVKVGAGGKVNLFNNAGSTHLLADVVGYYVGGASYVGVTPERVLDTRSGVGAPSGKVGAGGEIDLNVLAVGGLPATDVRAVVLNMTAAAPESRSFLTVWPSGTNRPTASSLNMSAGKNVANLVIAKVGTDGKVSIFNNRGRTHVIADVVGYIDAAAGVDLPAGLTIGSSNDWSRATWTVNSATLREFDVASTTFSSNDPDTPFVLDLLVRVRNNADHIQNLGTAGLQVVSRGGVFESTGNSTFFSSLGARQQTDLELSFEVDWGADLSDLRLRIGDESAGFGFEPGEVNLTGAQTSSVIDAPVGSVVTGSSVNGVCVGKTLDYTSRSVTWTTTLAPEQQMAGRTVRQADLGVRWLVLELDLDGSDCGPSNVFDEEFQLDVDNRLVDSVFQVSETIGAGFGSTETITLAYAVPLGASDITFVADGGSPVPIATTNLR